MENKIKEFDELISENYNELINLTMSLIKMDTVKKNESSKNPYGLDMTKALNVLLDYAKSKGLVNVKKYDNQFATVDLISEDPDAKLFMIMNHLDVVEVGQGWTTDPSGEIKNDIIYGRGATDNKGPLATSLLSLILINSLDFKLKNNVRLFIGLDEENNFGCVNHYKYLNLQKPDFGITPDAKFPIVDREYGLVNCKFTLKLPVEEEVEIETGDAHNIIPDKVSIKSSDNLVIVSGKSAHSANPEDGLNAINKFILETDLIFKNKSMNDLMNSFKESLSEYRMLDTIDNELFEYSLTTLHLNKNEISFTLDARFNESVDVQEVKKHLITKHGLEKYTISQLREEEGYYLQSSKFKSMLLNNYKKFRPYDKLEPITLKGTTYAKSFKNIFPYGTSFKDSEKSHAHGPDEKVHIDKLLEGFKILAHAILEIATQTVGEIK